MLLIGSSNQPDSFSAKFRWVGRVCSWQCSPFRALFSVLNSPRNRRKSSVYPYLDQSDFTKSIVQKFPQLELKERIAWISENLKACLPADYQEATSILLASLPPPNDNSKTDNDFGDFIYAPYADFVAKNGVSKKDLYFSLAALKEITMRFSAEDAIRYFINAFPTETMQELQKWSKDAHYHVRRLTSEGTRPKLPWSQKIIVSPEQALCNSVCGQPYQRYFKYRP